jgi:cAMP-dependent protein kinase regulator/CRP/FNR family cyclic AMP-dependent transcriptional regulator/cGMP-dependent protein kinase 2
VDPKDLKAIPLFASLRDDELRLVAQQADEVDVREGKQLITEGKFAYEFFAIKSGTADVSIDGNVVSTVGPGDFFGEMGLLVAERRTATVVATSPMDLIVLTGAQFHALERQMPSVAAQIRAAIEKRSEQVA